MTRAAFRDITSLVNTPQRGQAIRPIGKPTPSGALPLKQQAPLRFVHVDPPRGCAEATEGESGPTAPASGREGCPSLDHSLPSAFSPPAGLGALGSSPAPAPRPACRVQGSRGSGAADTSISLLRVSDVATAPNDVPSQPPAIPKHHVPVSPSSLNGTQTALQSCIRELDGILPHFGLEKSSDASLVDGTSPAVSASATSLAYSPEGRRSHELQYDRIEDPSVAPMLGGLVQDGDAAHMPHRMLEGSGATMSPDPQEHVLNRDSLTPEAAMWRGEAVAPLSDHAPSELDVPPQRQQARASDVEPRHDCRASLAAPPLSLPASLDSTQSDTDRAVAVLGEAMHRLNAELNLLGKELRTPSTSASTLSASPASSLLPQEDIGVTASLVVWPGSAVKTPKGSAHADLLDLTGDTWRILSPGDENPKAAGIGLPSPAAEGEEALRQQLAVREGEVKALSAHLSLVTKASRRVLAAKEEELQTLRQQMLARGADLDVGTAGEHCAEGGIRGGVDVACGQSPGATAASCGRMGEEPVPGSPGCSKEQLIAFISVAKRALVEKNDEIAALKAAYARSLRDMQLGHAKEMQTVYAAIKSQQAAQLPSLVEPCTRGLARARQETRDCGLQCDLVGGENLSSVVQLASAKKQAEQLRTLVVLQEHEMAQIAAANRPTVHPPPHPAHAPTGGTAGFGAVNSSQDPPGWVTVKAGPGESKMWSGSKDRHAALIRSLEELPGAGSTVGSC